MKFSVDSDVEQSDCQMSPIIMLGVGAGLAYTLARSEPTVYRSPGTSAEPLLDSSGDWNWGSNVGEHAARAFWRQWVYER